jgi:hypothetical protein
MCHPLGELLGELLVGQWRAEPTVVRRRRGRVSISGSRIVGSGERSVSGPEGGAAAASDTGLSRCPRAEAGTRVKA